MHQWTAYWKNPQTGIKILIDFTSHYVSTTMPYKLWSSENYTQREHKKPPCKDMLWLDFQYLALSSPCVIAFFTRPLFLFIFLLCLPTSFLIPLPLFTYCSLPSFTSQVFFCSQLTIISFQSDWCSHSLLTASVPVLPSLLIKLHPHSVHPKDRDSWFIHQTTQSHNSILVCSGLCSQFGLKISTPLQHS